ncbi:MAG: class I SAM-dependent methyltransferase [Synechococcaceae cyanobacterium]|nr:class I SAM-dependent methyltransferase [Synechococcaceae cyanobacterium]
MVTSKTYDSLCELGLCSEASRELFHHGTRDNKNLDVYRDKVSGVIYIRDFYVGDGEYVSGEYRSHKARREGKRAALRNLERVEDCRRRVESLKEFHCARDIADFGCGHGDFLAAIRESCRSGVGIELQQDLVDALHRQSIPCVRDLAFLDDASLDTVFMFHSFEHLPDPLLILRQVKKKLRPGGNLVIEVPHAGDFLLAVMKEESFVRFTLWSQHLILHTQHSLRVFLEHAGFGNVLVKGIQRYPLANHLQWLSEHRPGGHLSPLAFLQTPALNDAYGQALAAAGATDTLLAIGSIPE